MTKSRVTVSKISEHAQNQFLRKATCFYFIGATEKKVQSLANDDVKVNKTQRISARIDRFRTRLIVSVLMQLIFKVKHKKKT